MCTHAAPGCDKCWVGGSDIVRPTHRCTRFFLFLAIPLPTVKVHQRPSRVRTMSGSRVGLSLCPWEATMVRNNSRHGLQWRTDHARTMANEGPKTHHARDPRWSLRSTSISEGVHIDRSSSGPPARDTWVPQKSPMSHEALNQQSGARTRAEEGYRTPMVFTPKLCSVLSSRNDLWTSRIDDHTSPLCFESYPTDQPRLFQTILVPIDVETTDATWVTDRVHVDPREERTDGARYPISFRLSLCFVGWPRESVEPRTTTFFDAESPQRERVFSQYEPS